MMPRTKHLPNGIFSFFSVQLYLTYLQPYVMPIMHHHDNHNLDTNCMYGVKVVIILVSRSQEDIVVPLLCVMFSTYPQGTQHTSTYVATNIPLVTESDTRKRALPSDTEHTEH